MSPASPGASSASAPVSASGASPAHQPDHANGVYHWIYERGLSIASLGLISTALLHPHRLVDLGLAVVIPLHCHVGFAAIITDYIPRRKFPRLYPLAMGSLYAATLATIYGLYLFNTKDVGITEGLRRVWNARRRDESD